MTVKDSEISPIIPDQPQVPPPVKSELPLPADKDDDLDDFDMHGDY